MFATAGSACWRSTRSCSGTGGTRVRGSWRRSWRRPTASGSISSHLDEALADAVTDDLPADWPHVTTWGDPHTLATWSSPKVAEIAGGQRDAELRILAAGTGVSERAVRELLALQASDWAFIVTRDLAGDYPIERFRGHLEALNEALGAVPSAQPAVRNLAPHLRLAPLLEP